MRLSPYSGMSPYSGIAGGAALREGVIPLNHLNRMTGFGEIVGEGEADESAADDEGLRHGVVRMNSGI